MLSKVDGNIHFYFLSLLAKLFTGLFTTPSILNTDLKGNKILWAYTYYFSDCVSIMSHEDTNKCVISRTFIWIRVQFFSITKFSNFSTSSYSEKMSLSWRPENYPFLPKLIHPFLFPSSFHPPIRDGVIPRYQPTYRLQLCIFSFIMACLPSPFPRPKIIDNGRFPLKTRSHFPPRPCSWLSLSPSPLLPASFLLFPAFPPLRGKIDSCQSSVSLFSRSDGFHPWARSRVITHSRHFSHLVTL